MSDAFEVIERMTAGRFGRQPTRILSMIASHDGIGLCEIYFNLNTGYYGVENNDSIDEAELRAALKSLSTNNWIARVGYDYSLSDAAKIRFDETQAILDDEERHQANEYAATAADREERARENRAAREQKKTLYWRALREKQDGVCCLCDTEIPLNPTFEEHNGYRQQVAPFIRTLPEVGDVLPCRRCYGRFTHARIQNENDFLVFKKYWNTLDSAQQLHPSLISKHEAKKLLHIGERELQRFIAGGLSCVVIGEHQFFERDDIRTISDSFSLLSTH